MKIKKIDYENSLTSEPPLTPDTLEPVVTADTLLAILAIFMVVWMWVATSSSVGY